MGTTDGVLVPISSFIMYTDKIFMQQSLPTIKLNWVTDIIYLMMREMFVDEDQNLQ